MVLHTINKSPLNSGCFHSCLRTLSERDAVLLIEDGVYGADEHFSTLFGELPDTISIYVLEADLAARGLKSRINPSIKTIDDAGFVDLCCHYPKMQSWY